MRTFLHVSVDVVTALFFAASIGIGAGVAAISFTHRLGEGFTVAMVAFLGAVASFGYGIWRTYRPPEKASATHGVRPVEAASSR